jgi:hypothetical protein
MKTTCWLTRIGNALFVATVLSIVLCGTAFADSDAKNVVTPRQYQEVQKPRRIVYYVKTSASAIPMPLDRLGGIPTTTSPMQVIGDPRNSN